MTPFEVDWTKKEEQTSAMTVDATENTMTLTGDPLVGTLFRLNDEHDKREAERERRMRLRLYRVGQSDVFNLFSAISQGKGDLDLPLDWHVPEGAEVVSVHHDYATRSFGIVVCHESFDPVPEGSMVPEPSYVCRMISVKLSTRPE